MSLGIPLEGSKGILLSVRIIKVLLPPHVASHSPCMTIKVGGYTWQVYKSHDFSQSSHWNQTHTFELPETLPMYIGISYKSGLFKSKEYCSSTLNPEIFSSRKGIRFTEFVSTNEDSQSNDKVTVMWAFYTEENRKCEQYEYLKLISELEAEREVVKYLKNKLKGKLQRVKDNSRSYKEQLKNLLTSIEGAFDLQC